MRQLRYSAEYFRRYDNEENNLIGTFWFVLLRKYVFIFQMEMETRLGFIES